MIKVYWKEENAYLDFNATDTNGNGLIDHIEWNVAHLSNQTFDIIIINKAIHLDLNKSFISDIYDSVKNLDDIWSENISNNEYVRITFERNLTWSNDITLYPRIISGNPIIEVYRKNDSNKITEFNPVISNQLNKIYLTGMSGTEKHF